MRCAFPAPLPGAATVISHKGRSARRTPFYDGRRVGGCELHAQSLLLQCHPIRRSGLVTLPRFPRDEPQRSSGEACSGPAMALARAALATDFTDAARLGISPPIKSACPGTMPHEDYMAGLTGRSPCCMDGSYQRRRGPCIIYFRENRP